MYNNRFRILPVPTTPLTLWFRYIVQADRANPLKTDANTIADFSNVPYNRITYSAINDTGKQWILLYTLAICKEMLGRIHSKYGNIPFPNGEIALNGGDLVSAAKEEKDALIIQLRENLDKVSNEAQ